MNFDLERYSNNIFTTTVMIDRTLRVLKEAEVGIISLINRFSELSQTTSSVESNKVKKKIIDYLNSTRVENRTLFNTITCIVIKTIKRTICLRTKLFIVIF